MNKHDFSGQNLGDNDLNNIVDLLVHGPRVEHLDLSDNNFKEVLDFVRFINDYKLVSLDMRGNPLLWREVVACLNVLQHSSTLLDIKFDQHLIPLGDEWRTHYRHKLRKIIVRNNVINNLLTGKSSTLYLSNMDLDEIDIKVIRNALVENNISSLTNIALPGCGLNISGQVFADLMDIVVLNEGLSFVDLTDNKIDPECEHQICSYFQDKMTYLLTKGVSAVVPAEDVSYKKLQLLNTSNELPYLGDKITKKTEVFRKLLTTWMQLGYQRGDNQALRQVDFSHADLSYISFNPRCVGLYESQMLYGMSSPTQVYTNKTVAFELPQMLCNINIRGSEFVHLDMPSKNFSGSNCTNTLFLKSKLHDSNFCEATLEGADFKDCGLMRTNFEHVKASNARFVWARLDDASFRGADLRNADFSGAELKGADFTGALLAGASFGAARFEGANFSGVDLSEVSGLNRAYLDGAIFYGARLPEFRWRPKQVHDFKQEVAQILHELDAAHPLRPVFQQLLDSNDPHFTCLTRQQLHTLHLLKESDGLIGEFVKKNHRLIQHVNRSSLFFGDYLGRMFEQKGLSHDMRRYVSEYVEELPAKPFLLTLDN